MYVLSRNVRNKNILFKNKNILFKKFHFLATKFSIYLNRRVHANGLLRSPFA